MYGSGVPSAAARLTWMDVDPCGAEETGSLTKGDLPGGMTSTSWKRPTVSWDVRPRVLSTPTTTRTWMAWCCRPFWMVNGTSPEDPPMDTWEDAMILTFPSAASMYPDRLSIRLSPWLSSRPRQAAD